MQIELGTSCLEKTRYPTWDVAYAALRAIGERGSIRAKHHGYRLHVYRCRWCHRFHLGNEPLRPSHHHRFRRQIMTAFETVEGEEL